MTRTIGNPLSWAAEAAFGAGRTAAEATEALRGHADTPPEVRRLTNDDLRTALRRGIEDFGALRSDVIFLILIYPIIGIALALTAFHMARLPMLFPLAAGFTLLGPVVATGLYEMSRQREATGHAGWGAAFSVIRAPVIVPVIVLGAVLMILFLAWMFAASVIYNATLGPEPPTSVAGFLGDVLTTGPGWAMTVLGVGVGAVFAAMVLALSLTAFPMLIDRRAGVTVAVLTSLKVVRENPRVSATWGLIVAVAMLVGTLPLFLGLVIVLPVLGHATWHLYRAAVPAEA
ncbi:hypothetical protein C6W92_10325 [Roseovarius sp. A46]|uniref:DUF2189 domain-containing protein n=1 Tax=Roseovarius sp. A46 TaxID=2109331 RepID=UPI001012F049|nr:DUF2189 domain-containing protein [Roseovarius sp. A46]RXV62710.1 hypothetical protein C6W92_10325 [Roseovarius sp. A46]